MRGPVLPPIRPRTLLSTRAPRPETKAKSVTRRRKGIKLFSCGSNAWWTWNLGFASGLALCLQVVSGTILALRYDPGSAHVQLEYLDRHAEAWALRRAHSIGATVFFFTMYTHILRSILSSSLPSSSSISGSALYFLSLAVALLGYSLIDGNMARWALTVVSSVVQSLPSGVGVYTVLVGDYGITSLILPRIYALHFVLGLICPVLLVWHAVEVHHNAFSNDLEGNSGPASKDFVGGGGLKDTLVAATLSLFIVQAFNDSSWLWGLILDFHANDWPQPTKTPEPIGPEWYVLPWFMGLKLIPFPSLIILSGMTFMATLLPRSGRPWRILSILLASCWYLLGLMALKAHHSLEEAYSTGVLLFWAVYTLIIS